MPADDEDMSRAAYDEVADLYADHFTGTQGEQPIDLAMIDHFVGLLAEPRDVLDAGCGAGRMMPYLADRGCRVEGVDLSPEMVRRVRRDHPLFVARVSSLTSLDLADATFDGVFAWYSTIHSPDPDLPAILGEFGRVLRPGGHLLLAFQTGSGRRDVGEVYRALGHDVQLTRYRRGLEDMARTVEDAGLKVVCRMARSAVDGERDGQAVLIATAPRP
ncbi:class I SAM-dependent methyltransferase [Actinomycetota bacterium]